MAPSRSVSDDRHLQEFRRSPPQFLASPVDYVTMGDYDIVAVTEGPSDEVASAVALSIASQGNAKTTTMRAFTESEFAEIVKKMS
jgi:uncharacterized protein with GYD domain